MSTTLQALLVMLLVILLVILLYWWWRGRSQATAAPPIEPAQPPSAAPRVDVAVPSRPSTVAPGLSAATAAAAPTVDAPAPAKVEAPAPAKAEAPAPPKVKAPAATKADDLIIIEGIGPKIAGLLKAAGITTFAELAQTDVAKLRALLDANKLPFIDPGTWADQAALAAKGKMDELKALQGSLKGGRRS